MFQHIKELEIPGVLLIQPRIFTDQRGSFVEIWNAAREANGGFAPRFVQDNVAFSKHAVLRGLHFQHPHAQGKYVTAVYGAIYDVAVDLRPESPTFGDWISVELSAADGSAVYIPPGFAHGYQVLSEEAVVLYKCTDYYHADCDRGIAWNDPQLDITWPIDQPVLSEKDQRAPTFDAVCRELGLRASV
ncbi:MAG TPA: dTDP-4-dehydrorhamnose 3,5-epimerase [Longimicrobiales bacterium]